MKHYPNTVIGNIAWSINELMGKLEFDLAAGRRVLIVSQGCKSKGEIKNIRYALESAGIGFGDIIKIGENGPLVNKACDHSVIYGSTHLLNTFDRRNVARTDTNIEKFVRMYVDRDVVYVLETRTGLDCDHIAIQTSLTETVYRINRDSAEYPSRVAASNLAIKQAEQKRSQNELKKANAELIRANAETRRQTKSLANTTKTQAHTGAVHTEEQQTPIETQMELELQMNASDTTEMHIHKKNIINNVASGVFKLSDLDAFNRMVIGIRR